MKIGFGLGLAAAFGLLAATGFTAPPAYSQTAAPQRSLSSFSNMAELRSFLRRAAEEQRRREENAPPPPPPPPPPPSAPPPPGGAVSPPAALSITNNQISGVDEGDIVKVRGDTLVILRRGRLFSLSLAGGSMRPISYIDAFPPGVDGSGDWYDEMLISGDRVIVVGYSYDRGGTQLNRFRLGADGKLAFEDAYHLRSNDYYSSRNYATRLIGNQLIFYSPLNLDWEGDPLDSLPGLRKWVPGAKGGAFKRIASTERVFIPRPLRTRPADVSTLHSVTKCDLSAPSLNCDATVVLGNYSRTFFVSNNAIYLWTDQEAEDWSYVEDGEDTRPQDKANAFLYRIPFDRSRPVAVAARGGPVDQFSFHPDVPRNLLHVVVRRETAGDAMWAPEVTEGEVALLSIPMSLFGDGSREVGLNHYRRLPKPTSGYAWDFHNRFVGDHLLYGSGGGGNKGAVHAVSLNGGEVTAIPLQHGAERIEAIGRDAIVVGSGAGALGFTAIDLSLPRPQPAASFRLPNATEGETRSHSFFFRPDPAAADGRSGMLGLPVARYYREAQSSYPKRSAGMLFLNRLDRQLSEAGALNAATGEGRASDDGCKASCVDWYGNARPIFIGNRIFALLGYELVEGAVKNGKIDELARVSFAPPPSPVAVAGNN